MTRQRMAWLVTVLLLVAPASPVGAQWMPDMVPTDSAAARTPFGPGEHLVYRVKLGWFNVGYGHLTMEGLELMGDRITYRATMGINGRAVVSLDDSYTTWFDIQTLQSWRFTRDMNQGSYTGTRDYVFDPVGMMWARQDNDESGPLPSPVPFDEITFMYFIRTLPLEVGETYTFDRYFKETGNPVTVQVLRKDTRETDAGEFNTIVVRPSFQDEGLFSEEGEAELHFTDDERRLLVYMWVNMPNFPGGVSLHLQSITEGYPVNPTSRAEAQRARSRREASASR
ncbi:MAG: DUF3108 domain-containing protein [Gemmatimonadota bacterium]|nr:DUF3108 domain-containing protein [Gemmatimonadota bacterium]MDH3422866.1 DUF3108 domain-containing protein [Gemmatimonadota bacterium]